MPCLPDGSSRLLLLLSSLSSMRETDPESKPTLSTAAEQFSLFSTIQSINKVIGK